MIDYKLETYTLITLIAWFVVYIVFIWGHYGVLPSISESYYKLQEKKLGWVFTVFCWGLALLSALLAFKFGKFMFIGAMGAAFVGAASRTKKKITESVHLTGAGLLIAAPLVAILLECGVWFPLVAVIMAGLTLYVGKVNNRIWWIEVISFVIITISLTLCLNY